MNDLPKYVDMTPDEGPLPTLAVEESVAAPQWLGEPVLELRHLHRFFGKLKAVNDVSFKAYPGQVLGFIGPNGAGKTTATRRQPAMRSSAAIRSSTTRTRSARCSASCRTSSASITT